MRCLVFDLAPLAGDRHRAPPGAGAAANLGQPRHLAFIGLALVRAVGADRAGRWSRTVIESRNNQALLTTSAEFLLGQTPIFFCVAPFCDVGIMKACALAWAVEAICCAKIALLAGHPAGKVARRMVPEWVPAIGAE
ncbi:hypothetical protein ACCAA_520022 [Candidatus Accumulibacter aalborgensis]|uniref:Uncharacterized protein n=1 Tax=Candidatus Accumulibacter aalborgensis TaxID=1860102 RepID=A0A1A8XVT2_9PROT|nr:hypothetical protein ACCAA_520022 [Candidatus Accumulibacter aalborgensis]